MRLLFSFLLLLVFSFAEAQTANVKLVTWNIRDLGGSKSDEEIALMAQVLRGMDVIAIQEVVAKDPAGAQAVARLSEALNRTGANYNFRVSDPTNSSSPHIRERYAFIWKTSSIKLIGRPRLLSAFAKTVEREPYAAEFEWQGKRFHVANFHARPYSDQPEQEIAKFRDLPDEFEGGPLFLVGDFNVMSKHTVFNPWLKRGYETALSGQATTLRRKPPITGEDFYVHEGDNILVPVHQVQILERGILDIVAFLQNDLDLANAHSDHAPVYIVFDDFPQFDRERGK